MFPVIRVGGLSLSTYVLTAVLACAVFWATFAFALKKDVPGGKRFLLPPAVILSALVGARLLHAALNPNRYGPNYPVWALRYERLCLMGGLVLGMLMLYALCRELDLPFYRIADGLTPGAGLTLGMLKIGCFLNGCCGGKPTASPLGVVFPAREAIYDLLNTPEAARRVWPVQLFECAAYLIGIAALLGFARKKRLPDGARFLVYAVYVTAVRLCLHPLRETTLTAVTANIVYPAFYLTVLAAAAILLIRRFRERKNSTSD